MRSWISKQVWQREKERERRHLPSIASSSKGDTFVQAWERDGTHLPDLLLQLGESCVLTEF